MMRRLLLFLCPLLAQCLFAGTSSAQQASYSFFGANSGHQYNQQLSVSGLPQLGTTFTVSATYSPSSPTGGCQGALSTWYVALAFGFSNQAWGGLQLPAQLPLGFTLLVSPDFIANQLLLGGTNCLPFSPPTFTVSVPYDPGGRDCTLNDLCACARGAV
jgi:hypothetical protein